MPFTWSSFGATKPHAPTHINGGSDELNGPLNSAALSLPSVLAQDIVDAVNALESGLSVASAQDVIDSMGSYWDHYAGLLNKIAVSDDLIHSHDAEVYSMSTSYEKLKTITINTLIKGTATIRIKFHLRTDNSLAYGKIYKNGAPVGTERSIGTYGDETFSEDLEFAVGDAIEIYVKSSSVSHEAYLTDFRICGTTTSLSLAEGISENDIGGAAIGDIFAGTNSTP